MEKIDIINNAAIEIEKELGIEQERGKEIILEFIKTLPAQMQKIDDAKSDASRLQQLAHSMKGTAANLRLNDLYHAASELDTAARGKDNENFGVKIYGLSLQVEKLL